MGCLGGEIYKKNWKVHLPQKWGRFSPILTTVAYFFKRVVLVQPPTSYIYSWNMTPEDPRSTFSRLQDIRQPSWSPLRGTDRVSQVYQGMMGWGCQLSDGVNR